MRQSPAGVLFSPSDLADFLDCSHLTTLNTRVLAGELKRPYFPDPAADVLTARGREHEASYLAQLRADLAGDVVEVPRPNSNEPATWTAAAQLTTAALRKGASIIYQGVLLDGTWRGVPDFLVRVPRPSTLGPWSYQVVDTKLARLTKARAIVQLSLYSEMLGKLQGLLPETMRIVLGKDAGFEDHRVADYLAYLRALRARFLAQIHATAAATYPAPVDLCHVCDFSSVCDQQWRADDHLSLVAGISRNQRQRLEERKITTLATLGTLNLPPSPAIDGIGKPALLRIREQARVQLAGRLRKTTLHEPITPVVPECGLASLPPPSPGDLFFDIEGDPFVDDTGLEYLFGLVEEGGAPYRAWWAFDPATEKQAFADLVAAIMARLARHPDMHVYHYAPYEPTALKRLMGRHGTCEVEIDQLLRGGVLVDLYRAVRQGVRASVESYSIKKLEPLYGFVRTVDMKQANASLREFEAYLGMGGKAAAADPGILKRIEEYNRDDCVSAWRLRGWLEEQRAALEAQVGAPVPRPKPREDQPTDKVKDETAQVQALVARLTDGVPTAEKERTDEQHARWLLAQLLEYHRREEKSVWWDYYRMVGMTDDELIEDGATLGGLEYKGPVGTEKKSTIHRYRFSPQEHAIRVGTGIRDPRTEDSPGTVWAVDSEAGTIDLKRRNGSSVPHPTAVIPYDMVLTNEHKAALRRIGTWVAENGITKAGPYRAACDLLLRRAPRAGQAAGAALTLTGEDELAAARRVVGALDRSVLPIQGPPGSGKTYTGARMIAHLLKTGKKVGITANSHKVIAHLLHGALHAAEEAGVSVVAIQKGDQDDQDQEIPNLEITGDNGRVAQALQGEANLAAGTSWLWTRAEMAGTVDVLFVDEAGQLALANAVAVSQAAASVVLLGDPQQLDQPQKGVHPPGAEASALEHLLGDAITMPPDRGLFLARTRRMHPDVCQFISHAFYEGRLGGVPEVSRQTVRGAEPLSGTGLRYVPVAHRGNQNQSPQEVDAVARLYSLLVDGKTSWVDAAGVDHTLGRDDVLVVAPYNAQVAALKERLGAGARVGTVDKFQGQEAPVVFYSMATSTAEDAPRGMEFLYSLNRLNVAISRARCLAVLLASPELFNPRCHTPRQLRLANAFCEFLERATTIAASPP